MGSYLDLVEHIREPSPELIEIDELIELLAARLQWTAQEVEQAMVVARGNPGDALRCLRLLIQEVQPRLVPEIADDRISCTDCVRHDSTGRCGGWKELGASSDYHPVLEPLRRCEAFIPMPHLKDRRTGKQRWTGLQRTPAVRMISATTMKKERRKLRIDQCSCHVCERRRARGEDV